MSSSNPSANPSGGNDSNGNRAPAPNAQQRPQQQQDSTTSSSGNARRPPPISSSTSPLPILATSQSGPATPTPTSDTLHRQELSTTPRQSHIASRDMAPNPASPAPDTAGPGTSTASSSGTGGSSPVIARARSTGPSGLAQSTSSGSAGIPISQPPGSLPYSVAAQVAPGASRESMSFYTDDGSHGGSAFIGRGLPPRPSGSRWRGGSSTNAPRETSSTVGFRGISYAPSDAEGQSVSGLSASEADPDEDSADEGAFAVPTTANTSAAAPPTRRPSRGPLPASGGGSGGVQRGSRGRRMSNVPGRSDSRGRRASVAPDYLDDADETFGPNDHEDDEVVPHDRGEELVRRRMRARQKEKRRKEREAEKKRQQQQRAQQQQGQLSSAEPMSQSRPTSPRPRGPGAPLFVPPFRPNSPSPGAQLDRDGRPTYISLPRQPGENSLLRSPGMSGPATSPGPTFRTAMQGGQGQGQGQGGQTHAAQGNYPSPHSHIRRPSAFGAGQPTSARRMASGAGPARTTASGLASQDVFFDGSQAADVRSSVAGSSVAEDDSDAELGGDPEEGRDTLADLRARNRAMTEAQSDGVGETTETIGPHVANDDDDSADDGDDAGDAHDDSSSTGELDPDDVEYTLKDRQDAINIEHPFGLPIWKPALYKKSRTVTRNAENALHSIPSRAAERHLLPGNILWTVIFGIWLSVLCILASIVIRCVPYGGSRYARVMWELAGYLFWPFGKYVEVEIGPHNSERLAEEGPGGKYSFIDQDGEYGFATSDPNVESYTDAFTPVAARFPHDHTHRVPFNSRASRSDSRESLARYDTIRPGDVTAGDVAAAPVASSSTESSPHEGTKHSVATPRAVSSQTVQHRSSGLSEPAETSPLKGKGKTAGNATYGSIPADDGAAEEQADDATHAMDDATRVERELELYEYVVDCNGRDVSLRSRLLGKLAYGLVFWLIVAPVLGIICLACWGGVFTIPMAKLSWVLLKNLARQPLALHFGSAPAIGENGVEAAHADGSLDKAKKLFKPLRPGQLASRSKSYNGHTGRGLRKSKILLCTYRAVGSQYYKYTVGGVNILFVNTLPFVGFTIFDFFFLLPYVKNNHVTSGFLVWVSAQSVIFICSLGSVIPLSYFIGMAVASISAQSSIGMGAVINATFGSIIEIILYAIALTQEKARLVEGSIIGSILAGVLLMPGLSMCSGATRRKEQRFNARSAGVTSTMLIMAIIGILTPTLFYQIYGTFQLTCTGCPPDSKPGQQWTCKRCFYEHVPPATDPFYQENVKGLMYTCTVILVLSYGIGLWFSLRTHASQIWQNPQPAPVQHAQHAQHAHATHSAAADHGLGGLLGGGDALTGVTQIPSAQRASIYKRLLPASVVQQLLPTTTQRPHSQGNLSSAGGPRAATPRQEGSEGLNPHEPPPLRLPDSFSQEDYAKAMAYTASAFHNALQEERRQQRQQQPVPRQSSIPGPQANQAMPHSAHVQPRGVSVVEAAEDSGGHGGHDAPSWSRAVSLTVLLSCTVLYAIIAEILVDVVDVVLDGSGIDEKFLGVTLFALVPNTTEFMNAMSFAINGNIALSMEIGSAYALQVCLIQIPAMVAFSAYHNGGREGLHLIHRSFTLIFPRWDVIAIIFSVFLLTYTYIEARSNYYRGSICILSYLVLVAGFFFAPATGDTEAPGDTPDTWPEAAGAAGALLSQAWIAASTPEMRPALGWTQRVSAILGALWTR